MSKKKPIFSEKRIKEIIESLQKRVREHIQKQNEGKLPFFSRMPVTIMEIDHVKAVINRSRSTAQKLMKKVRDDLGKKPRAKVTVTEFCKVTNIPIQDVRQTLNLLT